MKNTLIGFLVLTIIVLAYNLEKTKRDVSYSEREYGKLMGVYQYCLEKEVSNENH